MLRGEQVFGREGPVNRRFWQRGPFNLDRRDVDLSCRVEPLAPGSLAVAIQRQREPGGSGHVFRIGVQLDLDPVREVFARFVEHHMPAGHQKQAFIALEEKASCIR
ncbi:MAG: hypothetical protein ACXW3X_17910 [Rhodoplanes sp.]